MDLTRVAPIKEDLTKEDLSCQVVRGYERAIKVSEPIAPGTVILTGEWGVKTASGMTRPGIQSSIMSMFVIGGTERFDSVATGTVTTIQTSMVQVKTNKFSELGQYDVGVELTVKSLGTNFAGVSPAASGDYIVGKVQATGNGWIQYEVLPVIVQKV